MKKEITTIGVLGCGWLGLPLAKSLLEKGYAVKGSTTSKERLPILEKAGVEAYQIRVSPEGIEGNIHGFLDQVDVVVIDFPPGLRKQPNKDFERSIGLLSTELENGGIRYAIFVSSTAVYPDTESFRIYTEDTQYSPTAGSAQKLIAAEKILVDHATVNTTVLRFGGLFGNGRHPVNYLAGRQNLNNPLGPVNLIHQVDCIGIIERILEKKHFGQIYNAVYPLNPPRERYYQTKAEEEGLEAPLFRHTRPSEGKIISSSKLVRDLDYVFQKKI